jgi:hypothetical protein
LTTLFALPKGDKEKRKKGSVRVNVSMFEIPKPGFSPVPFFITLKWVMYKVSKLKTYFLNMKPLSVVAPLFYYLFDGFFHGFSPSEPFFSFVLIKNWCIIIM